MIYSDTTVVIIYQKPEQIFFIHRYNHIWFDEYNSPISIEDNHTPGSLILQQDPERRVHNSDLLNLIPFKVDIISTPFSDENILIYEIEIILSRKKVVFNILYYEDFTMPYINYTIPNSLVGNQLLTQAKQNLWIISINGEEPIASQGALYEMDCHQTPHGKYKVGISLFRRNSYHRTNFEEIWSRFDQVRPVVFHLEVDQPNKPPTPKNIGEGLKGP